MTSRVVPLGELCEMDRQGLRPRDPAAAQLPLLGVEHVVSDTGALNLGTGSRIGDGKSTSFRFDERHVLYAKLRPYLNKVATPDFAGRCSTELIPLLPRLDVDREYLAHLLRRKETVAFVMSSVTGARMPRADMKALMSMPVPHPSLDEQRRIVDILNRAARIEALRSRAAERLREFVPALFIRMFGDAVENPKGWPTERLGDCCVEVHYGTSKKANDRSEGIPVLRMGNVTYDGDLDHTDLKHVLLSDAEIAKYGLREGDILFNRTNSRELVGKTGLWDGRFPAVPASYFVRLRLDESRADPTYVWAAMNSTGMKRRLLAMARGAIGQANINARELRSVQLPIPPLNLQHRYGETLERARSIARVGEVGSGTAAALIASLMSELFSNEAPQRCDPPAMAWPSAAPAP